jgi:hypothetical protein
VNLPQCMEDEGDTRIYVLNCYPLNLFVPPDGGLRLLCVVVHVNPPLYICTRQFPRPRSAIQFLIQTSVVRRFRLGWDCNNLGACHMQTNLVPISYQSPTKLPAFKDIRENRSVASIYFVDPKQSNTHPHRIHRSFRAPQFDPYSHAFLRGAPGDVGPPRLRGALS